MRIATEHVFGTEWPNVSFVQFLIANEDDVKAARRGVNGVPHLGRMDEDVDDEESEDGQ